MHKLQTIMENAGFETRSYSGRGMYGKSCLAVEPDSLGGMIAELILAIQSSGLRRSEADDIAQGFRDMRTDSMGRGQVVYFPDIPYTNEDEDEDEPGQDEADEP